MVTTDQQNVTDEVNARIELHNGERRALFAALAEIHALERYVQDLLRKKGCAELSHALV